jgi:hypothetical protein
VPENLANSKDDNQTGFSSSPINSSAPRYLFPAVALIAAAILGFEIALTRVFGTVLRYHFAFLVISMALCGLGLGGYAAHLMRQRRALSLGFLAVAFALSIDAALILLMRGVFASFPELYWLAALCVLIPFSLGGAFLAEAFARHAGQSGRLYAWDLAGAALMAIGIVGVLQLVSAIDACLLMAFFAIGAAWLCRPVARLPLYAGLTLGLFVLNVPLRLLDVPPLPPKINAEGMSLADLGITQPLFTELGTPGHTSRIIDTRWNAFARTDVVNEAPLKPGQSELDSTDTLLVYTNGNVPTNMVKWDGKIASIGRIARYYPLSDWAFSVAPLGDPPQPPKPREGGGGRKGKVLAIGPGGGLDALLALRYSAEGFYGAEINPSIVGLMHEPKYRAFNGNIYNHPAVHVSTAEGRAYVRERVQRGEKFSLVFSALTKTATAAQGMALLESFIYTSDAFEDYWQALEDNGQITIVLDSPIIVARFFVTALSVMQKHGINARQACQHIAIVFDERPGPYKFALVIQKSPLTKQQAEQMYQSSRVQRGLVPVWIPDQAAAEGFGPYEGLARGEIKLPSDTPFEGSIDAPGVRPPSSVVYSSGDPNLDKFIQFFAQNQPPLDVTPRADDRPFVLDLSPTTPPIMVNLGYGLGALLVAALAFLSWGLTRDQSSHSLKARDGIFILYFLALGIGFMLVEIPLIQKLVLPLGYPTLSLTVILFAILLGGGAGAALSQRFDGARLRFYGAFCALVVGGVTILCAALLPQLDAFLLGQSLIVRCTIAALVLLPLGVFLGTPFPTGIRLFAEERSALVPLIWGLNGIASVFGSFLAALSARNYGFSQVMLGGAATYFLAALLLILTTSRGAPKR